MQNKCQLKALIENQDETKNENSRKFPERLHSIAT